VLLSATAHAAALGALYFTAEPRLRTEVGVDLTMYVRDDASPDILPSPVVPPPPPDAPSATPIPIDAPLEEVVVLEERAPEILEPSSEEPLRPIRVRPPRPRSPVPSPAVPAPVAEAPAPPPAPAPASASRPPPSAGLFRPPRSATRALPVDYPALARREGLEGRVVLRLRVSSGGRVVAAEVATSSGHALLDDAALAAAARWTFEPALRDGVPVDAWVLVPVRFTLE